MDVFLAKEVKVDTKLLLGVGGILLAIVAFVLSRRAEKLVGIPVMTGYGSDHEKAMMEGTLKVSVATNILNELLTECSFFFVVPVNSLCCGDPATLCDNTDVLL